MVSIYTLRSICLKTLFNWNKTIFWLNHLYIWNTNSKWNPFQFVLQDINVCGRLNLQELFSQLIILSFSSSVMWIISKTELFIKYYSVARFWRYNKVHASFKHNFHFILCLFNLCLSVLQYIYAHIKYLQFCAYL